MNNSNTLLYSTRLALQSELAKFEDGMTGYLKELGYGA